MTLEDIWKLANTWCPSKAWAHLLEDPDSWGPSHELGHLLIEPAWRRDKYDYGRCAPGFCQCRGEECDIAEIAAMLISHRLVEICGHPELADAEIQQTSDYDLISTPHNFRRARALLRRKRLWPVPRSVRGLEALLKRRVGRPCMKRKRRQPKANTFSPLLMLAEMIGRGPA